MKVAVLGVATTKFGELWSSSPRALVQEVTQGALTQSNLKISDIDALYVGNMLSGILGNQENLGAFFAEELGFNGPAFKIEGACASGGLAFYNAALALRSGIFKKALVVGVEKMTDHKPEDIAASLMGAGNDIERQSGITFPGLYFSSTENTDNTESASDFSIDSTASLICPGWRKGLVGWRIIT